MQRLAGCRRTLRRVRAVHVVVVPAPAVRVAVAGAAAVLLAVPAPAFGWGFVAHRTVAVAAAQSMPDPLRVFFRDRAPDISDRSLEPDTILRARDPEEATRHFFELDELLADPGRWSEIPRGLDDARSKYGRDRLARTGVLPWWIAEGTGRLSAAMTRGSGDEIAREAGHLSHYVADLHQPLHLTRNFDGQDTGNQGVHSAYERFMIERHREAFRLAPWDERTPPLIEDASDWALRRAGEVFEGIPGILAADRSATIALKKEGVDYYASLEGHVGAEAHRLLGQAARATVQLWFSAWVRAGKPDPVRWMRHSASRGARPKRVK